MTAAVNQPVFTSGSSIRMGFRVARLSLDGPADLYVGMIDPYARVTTLRPTGDFVVRSRFVGLLPSMRTGAIDPGQQDELTASFELVAGRDLPGGTYEVFAVVTSHRTAPAAALSADHVIGADIKTFRVEG
jgi:hypothetical protein